MLAYAPRPDRQRLSPAALALIVAGHIAAIGAVMSAKMVIERHVDPPTIVRTIFNPKPPPPVDPQPQKPNQPQTSSLDQPHTIVPPLDPVFTLPPTDTHPLPPVGELIGTGAQPTPPIPLDPPLVRTGPRLATAPEALRPPYPDSKRESGDEASLRLKLTIDEHGRVIAVDPVGRVDSTFFEAARRHILRAWHYQPAMEGAKAIPSVTTITLRFELGNA